MTTIVFEDVPLNNHNNLKTGKDLSILQGVILSLCFEYELDYVLYNPTLSNHIDKLLSLV